MNLLEIKDILKNNLSGLVYQSDYLSNNTGAYLYQVRNLHQLRKSLLNISSIPYISKEIEALKNSWLFKSNEDTLQAESSDNSKVSTLIDKIKIKLDVLSSIVDENNFNNREEIIYIKLPEVTSFEDLAKVATDLKKGIEMPLLESREGNVDILTAESGSIWLVVSLGTASAVNIIAGICWAAAVIRKKQAEAKIFEQHAKTLELKNEALDVLVEAQRTQIGNILTNEAEAIANKHFDHKEPETIERLKLSITTIADLIDRGAKVIPSSSEPETTKLFPDYNSLSLIESSIKQLMQNGR
ncbi:hypothetical protein [Hymenobacter ruber]